MKKTLIILLTLLMFNCSNDNSLNPTIFNPELSVLENLNNGVAILDITNIIGVEATYGIEYGGGYIFHVDQTDGSILVAADYSLLGTKSWGDHFDLTNGDLIGDGFENTQQIVDGNLNDNSSVSNGLEFGSDDYAFKIVHDLEYKNYDDWFIPSSESAKAIYSNLIVRKF